MLSNGLGVDGNIKKIQEEGLKFYWSKEEVDCMKYCLIKYGKDFKKFDEMIEMRAITLSSIKKFAYKLSE